MSDARPAAFDSPRNEAGRLRLLTEAVGALNSALDYNEILGVIMQLVPAQLNCERATLYLTESQLDLQSQVTLGASGLSIRLKKGQGLAGWVAESGESLLIADAYEDSRFDSSFDRRTGFRTRAVLCVPAKLRGQETVAVLQALNKEDGFTLEDQEYLEMLASHVALALERERMTNELIARRVLDRELETARDMQMRLLPTGSFHEDGIEIAGLTHPCRTVGGDLFDLIRLDNGQICFTIGDVSGKGVAASLLMSATQTSLRGLCQYQNNPRELVQRLNRLLCANSPTASFVTFFLGILDPATLELRYVNAGHTLPALLRAGEEPQWLREGGMVLGLIAEAPYDEGRITLQPGDLIMFYTDGVSEAADAEGTEFQAEGVLALLDDIATADTAEICRLMVQAAEDYSDGPASDDITCVCVKIHPTQS